MVKLSLQELRQIRSHSQQLGQSQTNVANLVQRLVGLQSQELPSASLAIRARTTGISLDTVKKTRETERSILLTWAMRGTMHLINRVDEPWLSDLLNPIILHESKRRFAELKLDEAILEKALQLIHRMLTNGALTRSEIAAALAPHGIPVEGQGIAHIVRYAVLKGSVSFGAERDGEMTYVLWGDWFQPWVIYAPRKPVLELARRYLSSYAPASPQDFAVWSGLGMKDAKQAFADMSPDLREVEVAGESLWMRKSQELVKLESLRLLPRYDNYWLGYQNRDFLVEAAYAKEIHPGGGLIHPAMAINGEGKASWRIEQKTGKVIVTPYTALAAENIPLIEAEVADIGRFLGQKLQLELRKL